MSEFRQDIVNKSWILIAEKRAGRPYQFERRPATPADLPERDGQCSFCPGNEAQTPPEIARYPKKGDWLIRVVPNKFSALDHTEIKPIRNDFYNSRSAYGDQEVVITRYHNKPVALQDESLVDLTLSVYAQRIKALTSHEEIRYVHVIQNYGKEAGASLVHPHSQILAIPFLPDRMQDELSATRIYHNLNGHCLHCDIIKNEQKERVRIVLESGNFIVMAPYASREPFQLRIVPKFHQARFEDIEAAHRRELAKVIKEVMSLIYKKLENPAYNFYFHTLPAADHMQASAKDENTYHWHMVILPRIRFWAGVEFGTDIAINPVAPETAAKFFREPTS